MSFHILLINWLNNSIPHYNPDTDSLDIYYDGVLVGSLPCYFKKISFSLSNQSSTGWKNVKIITDLPIGTYTFRIKYKRTDSSSYDNNNGLSISKEDSTTIKDFSRENTDKTAVFTKTISITSLSDKIYFYLYVNNTKYAFTGEISYTKN